MKNTNTKEFRATVFEYLADSAYSFEETGQQDTQANRARHIWERFDSEFNHPFNRQRYPSLQQRVAEWHAGLALSVAYTYCDIIALAEKWHDCTLTEQERDTVCKRWFTFLALKTIQMWQKHGIDPYA